MSATGCIVLLAVSVILLVPASVLLAQVLCAALPRAPAPAAGARPRLAVLIPAHDESTGILPTIESVLPELRPGDRMLVVADNCTDDTAAVAAAAGAEVIERRDSSRRGKGYALDFGVRHLEDDFPSLVVFVDADCVVAAGAIDRIARLAAATGRPVQALYLMRSAAGAQGAAAISEFAWIVRNFVRPLGFLRLGLPCQLMGSGMAVPWSALRQARLASGHLVEDMKMGIELAGAGAPPLFCPEALVVSRFPATAAAARAQRTRWEHGHLSVIAGELPRMLASAATGKGSGLLALALDLSVPPLSLLVLGIAALFASCVAYWILGGSPAPLWSSGALVLMLGAAVGLAWLRFGRAAAPLSAVFGAAAYALGKIPLYLGYATRRQVQWERSKRDGH